MNKLKSLFTIWTYPIPNLLIFSTFFHNKHNNIPLIPWLFSNPCLIYFTPTALITNQQYYHTCHYFIHNKERPTAIIPITSSNFPATQASLHYQASTSSFTYFTSIFIPFATLFKPASHTLHSHNLVQLFSFLRLHSITQHPLRHPLHITLPLAFHSQPCLSKRDRKHVNQIEHKTCIIYSVIHAFPNTLLLHTSVTVVGWLAQRDDMCDEVVKCWVHGSIPAVTFLHSAVDRC